MLGFGSLVPNLPARASRAHAAELPQKKPGPLPSFESVSLLEYSSLQAYGKVIKSLQLTDCVQPFCLSSGFVPRISTPPYDSYIVISVLILLGFIRDRTVQPELSRPNRKFVYGRAS